MTNQDHLMDFTSKDDCIEYVACNDPVHLNKYLKDTHLILFRHRNSFALTTDGVKTLMKYYKHYTFTFDTDLTTRERIIIGRHVECPYHIGHSSPAIGLNEHITLFDGKPSLMIKMCGSANRWLKKISQ